MKEAVAQLRTQPATGTIYRTRRGETLRRLLLPRTEYHLYYVLAETDPIVVVVAVWSARRGRQPRL